MKGKISLGTIAAISLLTIASPQPAPAQSMAATKPAPCNYAWCPILVQVVKNTAGADVLWVSADQMRLAPKYSGATVIWELVGSPDYEFRTDSVTAKGANAAIAPAQFPLRLISTTQYSHDDFNNNSLTYDYELRVYKKGAPAGSQPLVSSGSIVNAGG